LEKDLEQIPQRRLYLVTRSETSVLLCLVPRIVDPPGWSRKASLLFKHENALRSLCGI